MAEEASLTGERLKNFRSIRRGIGKVVREIEAGTFGNVYRGSALETVVRSVAEQRQIFKGADHAFLWKPKLRIPDIYEHLENQRAFGQLLNACDCCDTAEEVIEAIRRIDVLQIKGPGPAVANLLYFIHPTLVLPFNTAIVKGYNTLTGSKVRLGKWDHYLSMRESVIRLNTDHRSRLSDDLDAIGGLLFDIGSGTVLPPPRDLDASGLANWSTDLQKGRDESVALQKQWDAERDTDATHTEIQGWLRDTARALCFDVWIASNDGGRAYASGRLGDGCVAQLGRGAERNLDSVRLIDVVWLHAGTGQVAAAFEVEHSTSIYSGIVRTLDLALGASIGTGSTLFLVAPDDRREDSDAATGEASVLTGGGVGYSLSALQRASPAPGGDCTLREWPQAHAGHLTALGLTFDFISHTSAVFRGQEVDAGTVQQRDSN